MSSLQQQQHQLLPRCVLPFDVLSWVALPLERPFRMGTNIPTADRALVGLWLEICPMAWTFEVLLRKLQRCVLIGVAGWARGSRTALYMHAPTHTPVYRKKQRVL